jgi:hypothetical protein
MEGKTPEITVDQARALLASIDAGNVVGLRGCRRGCRRTAFVWPSSLVY